jgi:hypothetical protein
MSSVIRVTAPSAPNPTTIPLKSRSPLEAVRTSPSELTSSSSATAVARFPFASPDPWVAVAIAPATEMCGSDARLASAIPCSPSVVDNSPYLMLALSEAVRAAGSTSTSAGNSSSVTNSAESPMSVKELHGRTP